jgi:type IV pilus assembly protein PilO
MADVRDTRQKLKIAIATLVMVDLVAAAVLLSPLVGSERSRREHLDQLWKELQLKTREVEPLRDIDKKISTARQQIDDFYQNRLPGQDSAISEELGKVAGQSGVKIGQIRYKWQEPQAVGLRQVQIEADFTGGYLQLARFINSLERDRLFFIVDSVQLAGGEQGGQVRLQLALETYLKANV